MMPLLGAIVLTLSILSIAVVAWLAARDNVTW